MRNFHQGLQIQESKPPGDPIRHSNIRSIVRLFHYDQLLAKCKVLDNEIRGDVEVRPTNKISKRFHHDSRLAGAFKIVYNFRKYG